MELAWKRAAPVACFGCGRAFEPPPVAVAPTLEWRPERAPVPPELGGPGAGFPVFPVAARRPRWGRRALVAALVILLAVLGARAFCAPAAGDETVKTPESSDDR
jgi:hypothetical protein